MTLKAGGSHPGIGALGGSTYPYTPLVNFSLKIGSIGGNSVDSDNGDKYTCFGYVEGKYMRKASEIVGVDPVRFWAKVEKGEGCWEWVGSKRTDGYGVMRSKRGKMLKAHRIAYTLWWDRPIGRELVIDHACGNKGCCNPEHLRECLQGENVRWWHEAVNPESLCKYGHKRERGKMCRECNRRNQEKWRKRWPETAREANRNSYWKKKLAARDAKLYGGDSA